MLGFDILIDDTLTPWLLEVNLSPSLNCDSPLDQKIKGELISDLFTMAGVVSLAARKHTNKQPQLKASCYQTEFTMGGGGKRRTRKTGWNASTKTGSIEYLKEAETKEEKAIVRETAEEFKRRGGFERIFPSDTSINYKNYFEQERPFNTLLCNQFGKIHRKGQGTSAVVYRKPTQTQNRTLIS